MIKALIFDLDGTLLNTLEDLKDSVNFALSSFGYPTRRLAEVRNFVGNGVKKLMELAIPEGNKNPKFEDCLALFKDHYASNMYNKTAPYQGIMDLLKKLKEDHYEMAIVSNKFDVAVKDLNERYFKEYIYTAAGESETIRKKPAPDTVFYVLKELGVSTKEAVYVGDSEVDIKTAQNAGLPCISVTWGFRNRVELQSHGGTNFADMPEDILLLIKGKL